MAGIYTSDRERSKFRWGTARVSDGNIFISYRRGADSNAAGRLADRLERSFPPDKIFFDIDSIPLGVDFATHIDGEVAKCDVQLVVIGPGWLERMHELRNPDDIVRIEIEAALKRPDIPVIPVLFEGAKMPSGEDLPDVLHPLVRRNAIELYHAQVAQVIDQRLVPELKAQTRALHSASEARSTFDSVEVRHDFAEVSGTKLPRAWGKRAILAASALPLALFAIVGFLVYDANFVKRETTSFTPQGAGFCSDGTAFGNFEIHSDASLEQCFGYCVEDDRCTGISYSEDLRNSCFLHKTNIDGISPQGRGEYMCYVKQRS